MEKKKITEEEKQNVLDSLVEDMKEEGYKVLTPEEHRKLVEGKKIVFSKQAIKDAERLVKESKMTPEQKSVSTFQRKINKMKSLLSELSLSNKVKSEQLRRQHNFQSVFKEMFSKEYFLVIEEYEKRFGKSIKLKDFKKELKENKGV